MEIAGNLPVTRVLAVQPSQLLLALGRGPFGDDRPSNQIGSIERCLLLNGGMDVRLRFPLFGHRDSFTTCSHCATYPAPVAGRRNRESDRSAGPSHRVV